MKSFTDADMLQIISVLSETSFTEQLCLFLEEGVSEPAPVEIPGIGTFGFVECDEWDNSYLFLTCKLTDSIFGDKFFFIRYDSPDFGEDFKLMHIDAWVEVIPKVVSTLEWDQEGSMTFISTK